MTKRSTKPTSAEIAAAADVFSRLSPEEDLPRELFDAVLPHRPAVSVNLLVFDHTEEEQRVLLTRRSDKDPYWPGQWHIPGRIFRTRDRKFDTTMAALLQKELGGLVVPKPVFVWEKEVEGSRGIEILKFYNSWMMRDSEPKVGELHPLLDLPEPMVEGHAYMILQTALRQGMGRI